MAPWATARDFYLDPSFIIKMKLNTEDAILTTNGPLRQWCSLRADDRSLLDNAQRNIPIFLRLDKLSTTTDRE